MCREQLICRKLTSTGTASANGIQLAAVPEKRNDPSQVRASTEQRLSF
jgi:hypothetical protein